MEYEGDEVCNWAHGGQDISFPKGAVKLDFKLLILTIPIPFAINLVALYP